MSYVLLGKILWQLTILNLYCIVVVLQSQKTKRWNINRFIGHRHIINSFCGKIDHIFVLNLLFWQVSLHQNKASFREGTHSEVYLVKNRSKSPQDKRYV